MGATNESYCFSAQRLQQFGLAGECTELNQLEDENQLDNYDSLMANVPFEDTDNFDITENRLSQLLMDSNLSDELIQDSRNLTTAITQSNRRLAVMLAASAARKDALLEEWSRKQRDRKSDE